MTDKVILLRLEEVDYPLRLKRLRKPPNHLYMKGNRDLLERPSLAIIGTRHGSQWGIDCAFEIGKMMSQKNITVVSGLAKGVDTAAHHGALEGEGSTIAVLGSGFDNIYPSVNHPLASSIAEQGLLISEYESDIGPQRHHFLKRNFIVAGLSDAVLVIDAPERSGALHTARLAHACNIPTFALSHPSAGSGNKQLIQKGIARPIAEAKQFLNMMLHPHLQPQQMTFSFSSQFTGVHSS